MVANDIGHLSPRRPPEQRDFRAPEHRGSRRRQQPVVLVVRRLWLWRRRRAPGLALGCCSCSRGGELYDAFADGSSEDETDDDDDEYDAYRDRSAERLAGVETLPEDEEEEEEEQHVIGDESDDEDGLDEKTAQERPLTK